MHFLIYVQYFKNENYFKLKNTKLIVSFSPEYVREGNMSLKKSYYWLCIRMSQYVGPVYWSAKTQCLEATLIQWSGRCKQVGCTHSHQENSKTEVQEYWE